MQIGTRMSYACITADVCRQIRVVLVRRGVGCGGWRGSPRTSAIVWGAYMVELWGASDWLKNDKKQLKVNQSRQTRGYLRALFGQKQVQCALDQREGSYGALLT